MSDIKFIKDFGPHEFIIEKDGQPFVAVSWESYLVRTFLSGCQQGLSGEVTPNLLAVTVDWKITKEKYSFHWLAYYNSTATEDEKESSSCAFAEVISHMPNISNVKIEFDLKEEVKVLDANEKVVPLKTFVFLREEVLKSGRCSQT